MTRRIAELFCVALALLICGCSSGPLGGHDDEVEDARQRRDKEIREMESER